LPSGPTAGQTGAVPDLPDPVPVLSMPYLVKPLAVLCLASVLCAAAAQAEETRMPNAFELAYTAMALDMESPELCAKISPRAESFALFNNPGTQVYWERSRCFFYVAVKSLNPALCREVVEADAWFHDGSYFSRDSCERLVAEGRPFNFNLSFDHALILREMGYGDADISARFARHPGEPAWFAFYLDSLKRGDGDFQRRLNRLPDFGAD
jgi:hypothetical protein